MARVAKSDAVHKHCLCPLNLWWRADDGVPVGTSRVDKNGRWLSWTYLTPPIPDAAESNLEPLLLAMPDQAQTAEFSHY